MSPARSTDGSVEPPGGAGRIELELAGPVPVVLLVGDFDLDNSAELRSCLEQLAERGRQVIVDLTDTTFIDSSAIHALVHGQRAGLAVTVRGRNSAARRTIELMGLDGVFDIED